MITLLKNDDKYLNQGILNLELPKNLKYYIELKLIHKIIKKNLTDIDTKNNIQKD